MKLDGRNAFGGNRGTAYTGAEAERHKDDAFFTPPWCVDALIDEDVIDLKGAKILEPSAGSGHIVDRLRALGYNVEGRDIHDWGRDWGGHDFFSEHDRAEVIITNPPFKYLNRYLTHALSRTNKLAILSRTLAVESKGRYPIWRDNPPSHIIQLPHRPDFLNQTTDCSGTVIAAWFVWNGSNTKKTEFRWAKPRDGIR